MDHEMMHRLACSTRSMDADLDDYRYIVAATMDTKDFLTVARVLEEHAQRAMQLADVARVRADEALEER